MSVSNPIPTWISHSQFLSCLCYFHFKVLLLYLLFICLYFFEKNSCVSLHDKLTESLAAVVEVNEN